MSGESNKQKQNKAPYSPSTGNQALCLCMFDPAQKSDSQRVLWPQHGWLPGLFEPKRGFCKAEVGQLIAQIPRVLLHFCGCWDKVLLCLTAKRMDKSVFQSFWRREKSSSLLVALVTMLHHPCSVEERVFCCPFKQKEVGLPRGLTPAVCYLGGRWEKMWIGISCCVCAQQVLIFLWGRWNFSVSVWLQEGAFLQAVDLLSVVWDFSLLLPS